MKKILFITILQLISICTYGTGQAPEIVTYKGIKTFLYKDEPLKSCKQIPAITPQFLFGCNGCVITSCYRNYVGKWIIEDGKLFLTQVQNACYTPPKDGLVLTVNVKTEKQGKQYADLKTLFKKDFCDGKVFANWFSGVIYLETGKLVYYDEFEPSYEKEYELNIVNGQVVSEKIHDNSKSIQASYDSDEFLEQIYSRIQWDKIPIWDDRSVTLKYSNNENGVFDQVVILRSESESNGLEAVRVMKLNTVKNIRYLHGKFIRTYFTIRIQFNQEYRYQYPKIKK